MKKIAFLIPTLQGGGAEKLVSILSKELDKHYDLTIIFYNDSNRAYSYSGKMINLNISNDGNFFRRTINFCKKIKGIRKIKSDNNYDVVVSFMDGANIVNLLTKKNEKVVTSLHTMISERNKDINFYLYTTAVKFLYKKSDLIITVSKAIKLNLIKKYKIKSSKLKVIYNPIESELISSKIIEPLEEGEHKIFDKQTIINVGRIEEVKGQIHLIRILSELNKQGSDINLIVVGEGNLKSKLLEAVKFYGVENNVFFLGFKNNPYKYLKRSSLYVHTSYFEGFGNVLIEAMACSLPVIATNCPGGPLEILSGEESSQLSSSFTISYLNYGVLTPPISKKDSSLNHLVASEKHLLNAIKLMLEDRDLLEEYSQKGKERANSFSTKIIIVKWKELLNEI
ncbi:glycosyltransferase [Exiguobacterium aurantiacum]|uniref:glycosyltransferase n=1 Tax=Exiguobacterium aurantiacum TaxID=33987 RepID=UPI0008778D77|nr:glycosyltransferase [Exiguobacterium aurantiacum]